MWAASVVRRSAGTKVSMLRAQPLVKLQPHAPMAMRTSRGAQVGRLQLRQASSTVTKESNQMSWLVASGTGAFAGTVSALTGVGGGIIIIPTLAKWTGLTQQAINGTSIAAVTVSATVGSVNYLMAGCVNIPMAALVTCSSIFFTKVGVQLAHKLSQVHLRRVVGAAMLVSVPFIYFKDELQARRSDASKSDNISLEKRLDLQYFTHHADTSAYVDAVAKNFPHFCAVNAKYLVAGAISGFVSGLCGLGGGILMTTYLTAASEMPQADIIGTSLLGIVPVGVSSTYHNLQKKSVHLPSALKIGVGLVAGVAITSKFVTLNVSQENLRLILGSTLATSAIVMLKKA
ncbi:hypothetical protein SDRG_14424 [Saprolegnia diclina VS20]|uniref:Membrane transporter protein n=1 Tax=Saprolegnia diclina (strain VS20) TaxID=1156394 RepID=T0RDZ5_SAPDV|nr:hypothetical protein SDRG_14424 [Saprolegnia diclina VS20]EQC27842.1 hypothetical protein SDRG_14424 [Saprolegnia diclina VS20]|eukprot:XP_008618772.1 hypothetical protein SDRG_14424 [Saprolegnia diclina VS20]